MTSALSTTPSPARVVLADGEAGVRGLLRHALAHMAAFAVVGEAGTGPEALRECRSKKPDLLVLDLLLPELEATALLGCLRDEKLTIRSVLYTNTRDGALIAAAMLAKPHCFMHLSETITQLFAAMHIAVKGGRCISSTICKFAEDATWTSHGAEASLTSKERAVLQLVAQSHSNKEIACKLVMAQKTVAHHRESLMKKLRVHDVSGLTRIAMRLGLVK